MPSGRAGRLDEGVAQDDFFRRALLLRSCGRIAARRTVADGADLHAKVDCMADALQGILQPFAAGRLIQRFTLHTQHPVAAVAPHQLGLQSQLAHQRRDGFAGHQLLNRGLPESTVLGRHERRCGPGRSGLARRFGLHPHRNAHHFAGGPAECR